MKKQEAEKIIKLSLQWELSKVTKEKKLIWCLECGGVMGNTEAILEPETHAPDCPLLPLASWVKEEK